MTGGGHSGLSPHGPLLRAADDIISYHRLPGKVIQEIIKPKMDATAQKCHIMISAIFC